MSKSLGKLFLAPLWLIQLGTGAKSFLDNPLIGSRWLNQRGLHTTRVRMADAMCRWRRRRLASYVRPEWIDSFNRDGFVIIEDVVPASEFPTLRDSILNYEAPTREMRQGDAITRRQAVDLAMLAAIPELRKVLERPDIVALMHYVASYRITPLHYIQTIISHVGGNDPDPQEVPHADSFHSSLKSWLFLNPVAAEDGPFSYVRGSHRFTSKRMEWERRRSLANPTAIDRLSARGSPRVSAADLEAMSLQPIEALPVPANSLVVADTAGFHARGTSKCAGERVEIWSYARRNPFLPWLGGDVLSRPGLAERRVGWLWAFRDRFEARIGQPWRNVGVRKPIDG